ncbi:MAG: hemerythrin domain-containing protein [Phycisphaerae bacterium]
MKTCSCTCSHHRPTEILKAEHRVIERVLTALERFAAQERIDADAVGRAIDFLRNFADGCHHFKEENELFPRMQAAGVPREGGPLGCMLDEHALGRALIRQMGDHLAAAARGDADAEHVLRTAAAGYVELLRNHIWKEDHVLFDLADRALSADDQRALLGGFDRVEREEADAGKHERYLRVAEELERQALQMADRSRTGARS